MGARFLIDTNTVIYYLNGVLPKTAKEKIDNCLTVASYLSIINKIELLGWNPPEGISIEPVEKFVNASIILALDDSVVQKTIEIRKLKRIKLPDAVIAATALVYGFEIISRNKSDFSDIAGLNCYDPFTDF